MHVITGMHRSGTSLTAHLIYQMGGQFAALSNMIGADNWNKGGYFEDKDAVDLNARLMLGAHINTNVWLYPKVKPMSRILSLVSSPKWRYLLPLEQNRLLKRAASIQDNLLRFDQVNKGKFVKDPRFAITLPAWTRYGNIESIILPFRNPASVATSIAKRDLVPKPLGLNLWYKYNITFLKAAKPDLPILLVDYDQFFGKDANDYLEKFYLALSSKIPQKLSNETVKNIIVDKERHHDIVDVSNLPSKIRSSYIVLKEQAGTGPEWSDIKRVSSQLNNV